MSSWSSARVGHAALAGREPGTGTIEEAANLVEYCDGTPGSCYADLRIANAIQATRRRVLVLGQ